MDGTSRARLPENLTLHVGEEATLVERAGDRPPGELVLAPVELHRRNAKRRLRETRTPKVGVEFADSAAVGSRVLEAAGRSTAALDRVDRLSAIPAALSALGASPAPALPAEPQGIEQVRSEVESVTGFHPERMEAARGVAAGLAAPVDADATELLDAATEIERALRERSAAVSKVELVRRAARTLVATAGDAWTEAYPDVDRVSLLGVSGVSAAQADLLRAVLDATAVPVHVYFRRGTGPYLSDRVPHLFDVPDPGAVVFEP